jgi:Mrp family chromosome partitioning ATPase
LLGTSLPREQLMTLLSSVEAHLPEGAPRTIAVTSALSGEGTTTIARDLAVVGADTAGKRVLLVTVLPPKAGRGIDMPGIGLDAVVDGRAELRQVIQPMASGMSLFRTTFATDQAASRHLFDGPGLAATLKAALATVDLVIIDAPPVLNSVAGVALARVAGGTVLVVEAEKTRAPIVDQARRKIEAHGGTIIGVVLNKRRLHLPDMIYRRL